MNHDDPACAWLVERMNDSVRTLVAGSLRYNETPDGDRIQVSEYAKGAHFREHMDRTPDDDNVRVVSASVLLSAPGDWSGGDFYLHGKRVAPERGRLVVFSALAMHAVTPVQGGKRWSMVRWYCRR